MSVASRNPFSLLDAEDSSRPASPGPAKAPAPAPPASTQSRGQPKSRGPASRGGKYYSRGGRPANMNDAVAPTEETPVEGQRKIEGGRGRGGRGRGGPRGGRGRTFDRHSASGKTDSNKKVHQGWGGDEGNTELKQELAANADAAAEAPPAGDWGAAPAPEADWGAAPAEANWGAAPAEADWGAAPTGGETPVAATEGAEAKPRKEQEEEEDNTLTLDQYLAKKKEQESSVPKLESTRQANEGAGEEIWKGAVPLTKNEEEETYFAGKGKSAPKPKAKKEEKVYLDIDARFERPDRGAGRGRGRGGDRGGDRGARGGERRGRGAPRPPRGGRQNGTPAAPNVADQNLFPSLA